METTRTTPTLYVVMPCYNEQDTLAVCAPVFVRTLEALIQEGRATAESRLLFVDDGSTDATWPTISQLEEQNPLVRGVRLETNRGQQYALLAGLMEAAGRCDAAATLDCDGQDDPAALAPMLDAYRQGYDIVFGTRSSRAADSLFKRVTATAFYGLMHARGAQLVGNHGDYRLLSAAALQQLVEYASQQHVAQGALFLRGILPTFNLPSTCVSYERKPRMAGTSKYTLPRMMGLARSGFATLKAVKHHARQ